LRTQAAALNRLGAELLRLGLVLAYHNHDSELRQGAREFHHMLLGTDPDLVRLCLDTHWIYRGAGNSQVAVEDVITLYADRVSELHLRQSQSGTWSEVFGPGDLDYPMLLGELDRSGVSPHVVLEQAAEPGTPRSLSPLELHRRSASNLREISPWH
jgi:inosose dehydratase